LKITIKKMRKSKIKTKSRISGTGRMEFHADSAVPSPAAVGFRTRSHLAHVLILLPAERRGERYNGTRGNGDDGLH